MVSLTSSTNYRLVWFEHFIPYLKLKALMLLFLCLALVGSLLIITQGLTIIPVPAFAGRLALLALAGFIVSFVFVLFSRFSLRVQGGRIQVSSESNGKVIGSANAAEFLSFDSAMILFGFHKKDPINVEELLERLVMSARLRFVFNRLGIVTKDFIKEIRVRGGFGGISPESFIQQASVFAFTDKHTQIKPHDLLKSLYKNNTQVSKLFFDNGVQEQDLYGALTWEEFVYMHEESQYRFWDLNRLLKGRGFAKRWAFGFTPHLDDFSNDLSEILEKSSAHLHVIGHTDEIDSMVQILARKGENNVLLLGDAGVGKSTVILGFGKRIAIGQVPRSIKYKRIVELDVERAMSGLTEPGKIQERFELLLSEAVVAGNIILVIDNLPEFLGHTEAVGSADLTPILTKYMTLRNFQVIATANRVSFHQRIENNPGLMEVLSVIEVKEPDYQKTFLILEEILPNLEAQYGHIILFQGLRKIVEIADQLIQEVPYPEKAIQLLNDCFSSISKDSKEKKVIDDEAVAEFLSRRTGIPLKAAEAKEEREKLLNLEKLMHERLIDQEEAVAAVAEALRRNRAGLARQNRPIGNFLFLGPTGVGKTETAKTLAQIYFGSEERMIRLDMTEYQSAESVERIIGSGTASGNSVFINKIKEQPFSLVLLDEIEKAHPNVLNLFLQVLDEGRMSDALGRRVSFNFCIIIGTSNAGAEYIRQQIQQGTDSKNLQKDLVDYVLKKELFKPEFINRFDAVVVYRPLGQTELMQVAGLMLKDLGSRLKAQGYIFEYDDTVKKYLVDTGFDPVFGARAMRRAMNDNIEDVVARSILSGRYKKGATIKLTSADLPSLEQK